MHSNLPHYTTVGLDELGEALGRLRLCDPAAQQRMERSLVDHGQIAPVLVRPPPCTARPLQLYREGTSGRAIARVLGIQPRRVEPASTHLDGHVIVGLFAWEEVHGAPSTAAPTHPPPGTTFGVWKDPYYHDSRSNAERLLLAARR